MLSVAKHLGIFPHCLSFQMRGFFVRRGGLGMTGVGVFLDE